MPEISVRGLLDKVKLRFERLSSEPLEKNEGQSRTDEQSFGFSGAKVPTTSEVTNLDGDTILVLSYLSENMDTLVSYDDISRGSGVEKNKVGRIVRKLVEEGTVVKSRPIPRHGTRYWINHIRPKDEGKSIEEPSRIAREPSSSIQPYVNTTTDLVDLFIRETRSHDVLEFLTWLEERKEQYE